MKWCKAIEIFYVGQWEGCQKAVVSAATLLSARVGRLVLVYCIL